MERFVEKFFFCANLSVWLIMYTLREKSLPILTSECDMLVFYAIRGIRLSQLWFTDAKFVIVFWRHGWRQKACVPDLEWEATFPGECTV